ncbi:FHA domain-containing protein, partial [Streptomyces sp. NPDC054956]
MQIRLTVLGSGSRSGHLAASTTSSAAGSAASSGSGPASCDVLVTAPVGTALAAVASGLAATVGGPDTGGTVVLYAGTERLDPGRSVLGEPPLVDGAVLSLNVPGPHVLADAETGDGPQLHVVAGPDAGGVHLLHPGAIRIGRSADADVPLDDPDVSRLHCTVTVLPDGRVAVADLGSTNGTTLDGATVGPDRVALAPGALLRVGESTLRLAVGAQPSPLPVTPDLEGHLALALPGAGRDGVPDADHHRASWGAPDAGDPAAATGSYGPGPHGTGSHGTGAYGAPAPGYDTSGDGRAAVPGPGAPGAEQHSGGRDSAYPPGAPGVEHFGEAGWDSAGAPDGLAAGPAEGRTGEPRRGARRGLGAWARKWVRGEEPEPAEVFAGTASAAAVAARPGSDDPAALLLAALGPAPRLWAGPAGLEVALGAGSKV